MNQSIASDIKKQFDAAFPNPPGKSSSPSNESKSTTSPSSDVSNKPINKITCAKAALKVITVRKYLMNEMKNLSATKMTLTPEVVQHVISTAIDTKNLGLIRLVLCNWIDVLDFRALEKYPSRYIFFKPKPNPFL
jgi:hypothetical protein